MKKREWKEANTIGAALADTLSEYELSNPTLRADATGEEQLDFFTTHEKIYGKAFKSLYYHLYTNANASRAETIIADLSNLLLAKIASERANGQDKIALFLSGRQSANEALLPILYSYFPQFAQDETRFSLDDENLRFGLREISELPLTDAPAQVLGEAFQSLIGPRLRGDKGQFFTPNSLVKAIVNVLDPQPNAKVVDPACGTGGFLVEAWHHQLSARNASGEKSSQLIGIDKDRDLARLSEAVLEIVAPQKNKVLTLNSLDVEAMRSLPREHTPFEADFVLTNPPFGTKIKVTDKRILKQFDLGHVWHWNGTFWAKGTQARTSQDPQVLFIELCILLLKEGGKLGIVLPEGVFGNSSAGYVWDFVRANGKILALLDCPRTTFQPSTDIKTNVLFFEKAAESDRDVSQLASVWGAVAINCGHDRRGRTETSDGQRYPDDFPGIGAEFSRRDLSSVHWQKFTVSNPYYLCPRYYDRVAVAELEKEAERLGATIMSIGEMVAQGWLRIRKGHEVGAEAYGTGDVPFVRTSDISNYEVSIDSTRSVSNEVYEDYKDQQKLAPGDILMVSDGRYRIGRTAILHHHNFRCVVQSHIRIIKVRPQSPVRPIDLLYLLNLPMVLHQIRNLVFVQSTLGSLGNRINEIKLPIPNPNARWEETTRAFRELIEKRAELLSQLREFEHEGYDL
ncbi:MAG: N-6 DNA methylase [Nitrososphaerota archaeon]|nr:N-6 DNA methylase [Nitrososphaerota archaeon]